LGKQFKNKSYQSLFTIGLLNGLLPCGMVYVALFGAIAVQSDTYGVFYMLLFGLGTMPLMIVVIYVNSFVTPSFRNKIQHVIPYVAVFIGCLFILRGLGLGIPCVSPSKMSLFVCLLRRILIVFRDFFRLLPKMIAKLSRSIINSFMLKIFFDIIFENGVYLGK